MRLPAHATVIAYLALFVAVATGSAWAATQIKSSKQIKRGAVNGSDIKDESLSAKDLRRGSVEGAEIAEDAVGPAAIADGAVGSSELATGAVGPSEVAAEAIGTAAIAPGAVGANQIAPGAVGGREVGDRSLSGADIATDSLGAAEIDESSLGLATSVTQTIQTSTGIDDGGAFPAPRSPQGDLLSVSVPPGRHFIVAHSAVGADDNGAGVECFLSAGPGNPVDTGTSVSGVAYAGSTTPTASGRRLSSPRPAASPPSSSAPTTVGARSPSTVRCPRSGSRTELRAAAAQAVARSRK